MATENIVSKKFRILVDKSTHLFDRISFWTRASDVEFNSGKNAQDTLGSIYGISDSLTSTSSNIAASTAAIKAINDKITNYISNGIDTIYNAFVSAGVIPTAKTPTALSAAVTTLKTNSYNNGYNNGYANGVANPKTITISHVRWGAAVEIHITYNGTDVYSYSYDGTYPVVTQTITLN